MVVVIVAPHCRQINGVQAQLMKIAPSILAQFLFPVVHVVQMEIVIYQHQRDALRHLRVTECARLITKTFVSKTLRVILIHKVMKEIKVPVTDVHHVYQLPLLHRRHILPPSARRYHVHFAKHSFQLLIAAMFSAQAKNVPIFSVLAPAALLH